MKPKKVGDVFSIRAVCDTSLLVAPGKTEGEASISQGWFCPSCTFLCEMDGFLKIGTGLGVWWIEKSHWSCPEDEEVITPYVQEGDLRYLPNVPYFQHTEAARDNVRHSLVCTLSAVLIYLGIGNIESYEDYLEMISAELRPELCRYRFAGALQISTTRSAGRDRCGNPSSSSGCLQRHAKDTLRLQLLRFDTRVHPHALALS